MSWRQHHACAQLARLALLRKPWILLALRRAAAVQLPWLLLELMQEHSPLLLALAGVAPGQLQRSTAGR